MRTLDKRMNRRKVPKKDREKDERKHLTGLEVEKLLAATKETRNEARDRCLILLMFRHGLRVSEAVGLKLSDVDMEGHSLHVKRLKDQRAHQNRKLRFRFIIVLFQ